MRSKRKGQEHSDADCRSLMPTRRLLCCASRGMDTSTVGRGLGYTEDSTGEIGCGEHVRAGAASGGRVAWTNAAA